MKETGPYRLVERWGPMGAVCLAVALVLTLVPAAESDDALGRGRALSGRSETLTSEESGVAGDPNEPGGSGNAGLNPATGLSGQGGASAGGAAGRASSERSATVSLEAASSAGDCSRQAQLGDLITCKPGFTGRNGGATYNGVSEDAINLVYFQVKRNEQVDAVLSAGGYNFDPAYIDGLTRTYAKWFDKNTQTWGRKVNFIIFRSNAAPNDAAAFRAEAVHIAQQLKAFAVFGTNNTDMIDELSRRGVICICGTHLAASFFQKRAPFVYTLGADGDTLNSHIAEFAARRLGAQSTADHAGPGVKGMPRKYGVVYPQEYFKPNADDVERRFQANGLSIAAKVAYASDINTAGQQATALVQKMRDQGVTTVLCVCDAAAPYFLMSAATAQAWFPEWLQTGYLSQDVDEIAQLYDPQQMEHNFGISSLPVRRVGDDASYYRVYKAETGKPAPIEALTVFGGVFYLYYTTERAGPSPDPRTYAEGMFRLRLPSRNKHEVTASFSPDDFAGIDDAVEVWWDRNSNAPSNDRPGRFQHVNDGRRYLAGGWPAVRARPFDRGCLGAGSCGAPR